MNWKLGSRLAYICKQNKNDTYVKIPSLTLCFSWRWSRRCKWSSHGERDVFKLRPPSKPWSTRSPSLIHQATQTLSVWCYEMFLTRTLSPNPTHKTLIHTNSFPHTSGNSDPFRLVLRDVFFLVLRDVFDKSTFTNPHPLNLDSYEQLPSYFRQLKHFPFGATRCF